MGEIVDFRLRTGFYSGDLILNTGRSILRYPVTLVVVLVGIAIFTFAKGLPAPPDRVRAYENLLPTPEDHAKLEAAAVTANREFTQSQGWLWSCDSACESNRAIYDEAQARVILSAKRWQAAVNDAKAELGPFSEQAVAETRSYFWAEIGQGVESAIYVS